MELFEILGKVSINNADANRALDNTAKKGENTGGKLKKVFATVGKGALAFGKIIGTGIGAGATAMGGLTIKALNLAGELEQNMGGSEAVFKEFASKMQETAKDAFSNMGLSTSEFLGTANKMGALFQGAGFSIEESSTLASDAMQRAADVASIMGIDTASAMEAVAGAAKGNFTMMDNLGVAMNDTTLQAYALEKGISKSTSEMTNQEKIGLAMELFMEKTAYAAGNYAKENETLAGSLGTAKAALTNFLDGSGDVDSLVTAFSNTANVIIKNLKEIAPRLVDGLVDIVNQILPMLPDIVGQLLPVIIDGAIGLMNGIVAVLPQLIKIIEQVIPSLIEGFVQIIVNSLPTLVQILVAALQTLLPALIEGLMQLIIAICNDFSTIIQPLIDALPTIVLNVVNALMQNLPQLIDGLITLTMGIVEAIPQIIQGLVDALPDVVAMIVTGLLNLVPQLIKGWVQMARGVADARDSIWASVKQAFVNIFKGIFKGIIDVFSNMDGWFGDKFRDAKDKATSAFSNIKEKFTEIKEKITSAFSDVKEKLMKPFEDARDKIEEIAEKIKGFFKGDIEMPKIKKPSFSISPEGWKIGDLLDGVIPKLDIKWNAKGAIMKQPTLFGYNPSTGRFQGGGEAGDEAIAPISVLQDYVASAVASQNTVLVDILVKILNAIVQMDGNMGGNLRDALDGVSLDVNKREFGRLVKGAI